LLNLVFKIVSDEHPKIPSRYSQGLSDLVDRMLEKKPEKRPKVSEILKLPIVKEKML
jgi:serine/threonine protein kinase